MTESFDKAKKEKAIRDMKATLKEQSKLHNLFWKNMVPIGKGSGDVPTGELVQGDRCRVGGFIRFTQEFTTAVRSVKDSGWAALTYCHGSGRSLVTQIEKHNVNVFPGCPIVLDLDTWSMRTPRLKEWSG